MLGCWSAEQVIISTTVLASRQSTALAAVETLIPELAQALHCGVSERDEQLAVQQRSTATGVENDVLRRTSMDDQP